MVAISHHLASLLKWNNNERELVCSIKIRQNGTETILITPTGYLEQTSTSMEQTYQVFLVTITMLRKALS